MELADIMSNFRVLFSVLLRVDLEDRTVDECVGKRYGHTLLGNGREYAEPLWINRMMAPLGMEASYGAPFRIIDAPAPDAQTRVRYVPIRIDPR